MAYRNAKPVSRRSPDEAQGAPRCETRRVSRVMLFETGDYDGKVESLRLRYAGYEDIPLVGTRQPLTAKDGLVSANHGRLALTPIHKPTWPHGRYHGLVGT